MRPVALLAPGRGKTRRAYVWVYRTTNFALQRAVLYDFTLSRAGEHPRRVLEDFSGKLVTHDFSGYHALHAQGITAALCMAHARRKLFEAHQLNASKIAAQAVVLIAELYEIEREAQGSRPRRKAATAPAARQAGGRRLAYLAHGAAPDACQGRRDRQGHRLLTEQLARADALPGRRARSLGAYFKDVFERLPTLKQRDLAQLLPLPHN